MLGILLQGTRKRFRLYWPQPGVFIWRLIFAAKCFMTSGRESSGLSPLVRLSAFGNGRTQQGKLASHGGDGQSMQMLVLGNFGDLAFQ
ncbi:hypothetical protein Pla52o_05310 [Novipirellula galeiformis]|uniref:Uncharacterized protein n=1 Tax=Novipirellula galeiformis TaxID=2528004 RepID=A0A5C6CQR7_9BACT|nr:hypothetical protein Pla52o_05310 [Novipirellula galeiformis]